MRKHQQQFFLIGGIVLIILVAAVAVLISTSGLIASEPVAPASLYDGLTRRVTPDGAPILGDPGVPLTVVEFLDFSCPHCGSYQDTIHSFIDQYVRPGKARLEIHILSGLDPTGSPLAARAALCAGEQNAFWEMADALLDMQQRYGEGAFTLARIQQAGDTLNLNASELSSCVRDTTRFQETLQGNVDLAIDLDVQATPAILVRNGSSYPVWIESGGHKLAGRLPLETLGQWVDSGGITG
jgi:protein-disulfide isomerase